MSRAMIQYRILISAPGDVTDEMQTIDEVFADFNASAGDRAGVNLRSVHWRRDSYSELGDHPQNIINRQIVDDCDAVIAVFWTRFGSPTERYGSGTEEEIMRLLNKGKHVFLYFSDTPVPPDAFEQEQYQRVQRFKEQCRTKGLYFGYKSLDQFRDLLRRHMEAHFVESLHEGRTSSLMLGCYDGSDVRSALILQRSAYSSSKRVADLRSEAMALATKLAARPSLARPSRIGDRMTAVFVSPMMPEPVVVPNETVDRIDEFCVAAGIPISADVFDLGDLGRQRYSFSTFGGGPSLVGSEEEKQRLHDIEELGEAIAAAQCLESFLGEFDAMSILRLLVSNSGTSPDRNIDVDVFFPKGVVVKPKELPVPGKWCIEAISDSARLLYQDDESYRVKPYPDYPKRRMIPADLRLNERSDESYERSVSRYREDVERIYSYVYFDRAGYDVVHTQISYLKHNESVFLPARLFLREAVSEITYEIRSENSPTLISGRLG